MRLITQRSHPKDRFFISPLATYAYPERFQASGHIIISESDAVIDGNVLTHDM